MKKIIASILLVCALLSCEKSSPSERIKLADHIEKSLVEGVLQIWYPRVIDEQFGGYLTNFDYQWQPMDGQDKMIVTQARHVWTASKAAMAYPDDPRYLAAASHGYSALKNTMWDEKHGGFYQWRDQKGGKASNDFGDEKRTYGNAFGLYAVSAYYKLTKDQAALAFAKDIFYGLKSTLTILSTEAIGNFCGATAA